MTTMSRGSNLSIGGAPLKSKLLHRIADKVIHEDSLAAAAERKKPKPVRTGGKKTLLTDAQVLEARALHEFGGRSIADIARRYNLEYDYTRKLCDYTVRSKLIAKREHLPKAGELPAPGHRPDWMGEERVRRPGGAE